MPPPGSTTATGDRSCDHIALFSQPPCTRLHRDLRVTDTRSSQLGIYTDFDGEFEERDINVSKRPRYLRQISTTESPSNPIDPHRNALCHRNEGRRCPDISRYFDRQQIRPTNFPSLATSRLLPHTCPDTS